MKLLKHSFIKFYLLTAAALIFMYSYCPYKIEFKGNYDKIWAHRVNSKQKLISATNYFKGVELDLVYNETKSFLDVNHPPAKSIGLTFEAYLASLPNDIKPNLWLDIKNLKEDNALKILKKIQFILNKEGFLASNVIIETRYSKALPIFTAAGFKTSYYLPYGLSNKEEKVLENEIDNINKILFEQPNIAISSNYKDYPILKKYFPEKTKYLWVLVYPVHFNYFRIHKILQDPTVKIILVNYKALKGNR